jgi:hypothetical protein
LPMFVYSASIWKYQMDQSFLKQSWSIWYIYIYNNL